MGQEHSHLDASDLETLRGAVLTDGEMKRLYEQFRRLDTDRSGTLSRDELYDVAGLKDNPLLDRVISVFDTDKDDSIDFHEFLEGFSVICGEDSEAKLRFAFQVYDKDCDGLISNRDLYEVLTPLVGTNLTPEQLQQVVDKTIIRADTNHDGKVSYEEFKSFVEKSIDNLASQFTMDLKHEAIMFKEESIDIPMP